MNKKLVIGGVIAGLFAIGVGGSYWYNSTKRERKQNEGFRDSKIAKGDVHITIRATGNVQPENRLEIKAPIAGRVESVLVQEGQRVRRGQVLAWMSSTERAAVIDAARSKGAEELARWEDLYRPTPILAPINGMIILRSVEPGQTFAATDSILVLSDRLTVKAQVDETDLAQIKVGITANVILDAYPQNHIAAKVSRIAFEAKTVNNVTMYEVDVTPLEPSEIMRSGMTSTVRFDVASKSDVVLIPNDAIQNQGGKTTTLVVENGQRKRTEIEVGLTDGKVSEVVSGLNVGDTVAAPMVGDAKAQSSSNPFMPSGPRGGQRPGGGSGGGRR